MSKSKEEIYDEFYDLVNMTPSELKDWLDTEKSKSVAQDSGDGEAIGHKSGRKIISIKETKKDKLTDSQYDHMNKVVSYIKRHKAQKPDSDSKESDWRYSLKIGGTIPVKKKIVKKKKIMSDYDKDKIWKEFQEKQNMTSAELEYWLSTDESKNAGKEMENVETTGHRAGRSILKIKSKSKADLTESNWERINETVGVYHQKIHPSQKPNDNVKNINWYYSLRNWGHDPLK